VLAYATKFHNLGVPPKIVEALCMCWASQMAQDLCLQNCVMETGFLPLAQAWVNKSKRPTTLFDAILQDCKSINKESANAKVLFVKKQGNRVANTLAKMSFTVEGSYWIDYIPQ